VIGLFLGLTPQVKAGPCDAPMDNRCESLPLCNITTSGTPIYVDTKTTISPSRKDGDYVYFAIKACSPSINISGCTGQNVVVSWTWGGLWQSAPLKKATNGCYEGEMKIMDLDYNFYRSMGGTVDIDIELDNTNGGCQNQLPLCRRVFTHIGEDASCIKATNDLLNCGSVKFETKKLAINQVTNFSVTIDDIFKRSFGDVGWPCEKKVDKATISLYDPNGKMIIDEIIHNETGFGQKNSYSFTPKLASSSCGETGGYKLTLRTFAASAAFPLVNHNLARQTECTFDFGVGSSLEKFCAAPEAKSIVKDIEKFKLCEQIDKTTVQYQRCQNCLLGLDLNASGVSTYAPDNPKGIWTAVGCIKTDPQNIIITLVKLGLGVAGGGALLMILSASFIISVSAGDAKKFTEAKEMISNAVIGLIFIIMSITILQFIGVSLFHIPGFGN
jgi:hypothetical protein